MKLMDLFKSDKTCVDYTNAVDEHGRIRTSIPYAPTGEELKVNVKSQNISNEALSDRIDDILSGLSI